MVRLPEPNDPPKKSAVEKIEDIAVAKAEEVFDKKISEAELVCAECSHKIEPKPEGEPEVDVVVEGPEEKDDGPATFTIKDPQTYTLKE